MTSSKRFDTDAAIDRYLREINKAGREISFVNLVDSAAQSDSAVRRHRDELKEFGDLRNAIVHAV